MKLLIGPMLLLLFGCDNSGVRTDQKPLNSSELRDSNGFTIKPFKVDPDTVKLNIQLKLFIQQLDTSVLKEFNTVPEIPKYILSYLDSTCGGFDIASPGEEWQEGCIVMGKSIQTSTLDSATGKVTITTTFDTSQPLPHRQLVYFGVNDNIALMVYKTGGFGTCGHILILELLNKKVIKEWHGTTFEDLSSKASILQYLIESKDNHLWD
jgi:hypothetical protein